MFQRFRKGSRRGSAHADRFSFAHLTDRARQVLVLAHQESHLLGHNFIGTEHLLLGLLREGEGVGAKSLESLGISFDAVRTKVEETVGSAGRAIGSPPFTPRARKARRSQVADLLVGGDLRQLGPSRLRRNEAAEESEHAGSALHRGREKSAPTRSDARRWLQHAGGARSPLHGW